MIVYTTGKPPIKNHGKTTGDKIGCVYYSGITPLPIPKKYT